jgi:hypothetical protein
MSLTLTLLSLCCLAMAAPFYVAVLASNRANGSAFNTFTTAKSVINAADLVQLPINALYVGAKFRVRVAGILSCVGTTSGTVTFQVMFGSVVAWTSGAIQMTTTAEATLPFVLEVVLRVTAVDTGTGQTPVTAATILGQGYASCLILQLGAGAAAGAVTTSIINVPETSPANGTAFASSTTENLDFWTGFSISNASNGITVNDYVVEQLQ